MTVSSRDTAIQARLDAATPGPWQRWVDQEPPLLWGSWDGMYTVGDDGEEGDDNNPVAKIYVLEDIDLIANAPADLAYLLAEKRQLEARIEKALGWLGDEEVDPLVQIDCAVAALTNEGND